MFSKRVGGGWLVHLIQKCWSIKAFQLTDVLCTGSQRVVRSGGRRREWKEKAQFSRWSIHYCMWKGEHFPVHFIFDNTDVVSNVGWTQKFTPAVVCYLRSAYLCNLSLELIKVTLTWVMNELSLCHDSEFPSRSAHLVVWTKITNVSTTTKSAEFTKSYIILHENGKRH